MFNFSLRLTIFALKFIKTGAEGSIKSLQSTFGLLRRIIGVLPAAEDSIHDDQLANRVRRPSTGLVERRKLQATSLSIFVARNASNTALISATHRRDVYELQLALWLTASALYRELKLLDKAQNAIDEADKILESLAQIQQRIRNHDSRLFRDEDNNMRSAQASGGYWKEHDPLMKRIQADVALEVLIRPNSRKHFFSIQSTRFKMKSNRWILILSIFHQLPELRWRNKLPCEKCKDSPPESELPLLTLLIPCH
jgi:hypothetical protein